MSVSQKLRWKRYVNKLRFIHGEIELIEQIASKTGNEFQAYLEDYCAKNNLNLRALNKEYSTQVEEAYKDIRAEKQRGNLIGDSEDEIESNILSPIVEDVSGEASEIEKEDSEIHEAFSKLFKKIALQLHPDRLPKDLSEKEIEIRLKLFNDAKESLEQKRYFILLDLAERYSISAPKNYSQQINWMRRQIDILDLKLESKKTTYNYLFAECETEEEKDTLVRRFIKQLFGI